MTDNASLDDFFAKKDRNKKKQKIRPKAGEAPITNTDDSHVLLQSLAHSKDKLLKKDKTQSGYKISGLEEGDEEWLDFEEKTEKDYTGLRIQNIQISSRIDSENDTDNRDGDDDSSREDKGDKDDSNTGPWNKTTLTSGIPNPGTEPEPNVISEPQKTEKYIPPGLRRENKALGTKQKKKKGAPDIKNEEEFPTLGTAPPADWTTQSKTFEEVRSGGKRLETENNTLHLTLENKFAALS